MQNRTDTPEFNEGDLVEAVKGERVIRDRITRTDNPFFGQDLHLGEPVIIGLSSVASYMGSGYTLTTIEKAAPKLPTEPGYYRVSGMDAEPDGTLQLDTRGQWWWVGNEYRPSPEALEADRLFVYLPLTRLEPVPVTVKRFTSRLREVVTPKIESHWYTSPTARGILTQADTIAAEFGVTR